MHEGRMTICRQNGDVNFVGVPTGEKGVFVETVLPFPVPRPIPKTFSSELCTGPLCCATVTDFIARTSNACLAQAFGFWAQAGLAGDSPKEKSPDATSQTAWGSMRLPQESSPGLQARRAFLWKYERFLKEGGVQGREGTFFRKEKFPPSPHILVSS